MLTNKQRKFWGIIFIVLAISLLTPIPDPLDLVGFKIFSIYKGVTIDSGNIALYYFDYLILTFLLGIIAIIIGMNLLGWSWRRVWKKINIEKYWIAFLLAILVVIAIAWLDIQGMNYWSSFSSAEAYTNGLQGLDFWMFFKSIVMVLFLILPVAYFFLYRRDLSEAISLWTSEFIIWIFGFSDVMYFVLQKQSLPTTLSWLNNHPIIGGISNFLGYSNVNPISLLTCVILGFILAYASAWVLKNKF